MIFVGDEAGDVSLNFAKGASSHLVIALLKLDEPEGFYQGLADFKRRFGLPLTYEFSFHDTTNQPIKSRFFRWLASMEFEGYAVAVDKPELVDPFKAMVGRELYVYFLSEVISLIPWEKRIGATLILDEFDRGGKTLLDLGRVLKARQIRRGFKKIVTKRSRSEDLIQVADMIAGAIMRRYTTGDDEHYAAIAGKVKELREYSGN